jgi:uncharacterized cupredoxin-like copper-binding protein
MFVYATVQRRSIPVVRRFSTARPLRGCAAVARSQGEGEQVGRNRIGALGLSVMVALSFVAAACSDSSNPSASTGGGGNGNINATEKDFSITLDSSEAPAGTVKFTINNTGPSVHEFVVFKTDLAPDKLPLVSGAVDEEGEGVTHIDEVEDIAVDATETLSVSLEAGKYVVICNVPGHYVAGMHAPLTVGG